MLGTRLPRHRKFNYEPRFWNPEQERREKKHRIEFKRSYLKRKAKQRSLIWLFVLTAMVIWAMTFMARVGK